MEPASVTWPDCERAIPSLGTFLSACCRDGVAWVVDELVRLLVSRWVRGERSTVVQVPARRHGAGERPVRLVPPAVCSLHEQLHRLAFREWLALQPGVEPLKVRTVEIEDGVASKPEVADNSAARRMRPRCDDQALI